ncbi:hypothetical protein CANINC_004457 [Pichia inconspicua]|uniref:Protein ZIP4 homolog n=1 Tax=Pichia inconspicua TaxID=52247 RepID=A0A4V4NF44_9ASCO|nr:hypothetical protein CANINC_004457 [[Candida] inconspicua]
MEVISTLLEMISSCEHTTKILSEIQSNKDVNFEIGCIKARLVTLIPILESTERGLRIKMSDTMNAFDEGSAKIVEVFDKLEDRALSLWNVLKINDITENRNKYWYQSFLDIKLELMHFSCMLLSIHALIKNKESLKFRVLNNFLRCYYESIDMKSEVFAKVIKEYINTYISDFESYMNIATNIKFQTLKVEFYMLEMHASILAHDISMAKYYEGKANLSDKVEMFHRDTIFNLCRSLFNDALQLYKEDKIDDAFYFLERCFLVMEKLQIDKEKPENKIKVSTLIMLIKCCIKINSTESIEKAEKLIKYLSINEHKKIEALKLELEMIQQRGKSPKEIDDDLMKFVISVPDDANLLKHLRLLFNSFADRYPSTSKNCLMYLFANKINFQHKDFKEVAESYLISMIWIITSKLTNEPTDSLLKYTSLTLEMGDKKIVSELSIETSNSIIVMLFSAGRKCMKSECFVEAIRWFEFCTMRMFNNFQKEEVLGKIQRSILQCCIETDNYNKFESCWKSMSFESHKNPLSMYYRFKVLLKSESENTNELCEILDNFGKVNNTKVIKLLALCVIDCKEIETHSKAFKEVLSKAMSRLIDKSITIGDNADLSLVVVALRSCFLINGKNIESGIDIEKSVLLINQSVNQFLSMSKNDSLLPDKEWFACQCYNHGIHLLGVDGAEVYAIELFSNCTKLIDVEIDHHNINWYCKAVIFKSICISRVLKSGSKYNNRSTIDCWKEILNECEKVNLLIKGVETFDQKEILIQCKVTQIESLVELKEYEKILAVLKDSLLSKGKYSTQDITEVDFLMEKLLEKNRDLDFGHYSEIKQLLETVFIEIGCSNLEINSKQLFKWLFLMVSKLLEYREFEETLLNVIKMFKEHSDSATTGRVTATEIGWLAGVCWNHGISCIMDNKKSDDSLNNLDLGNNTEDSSILDDDTNFCAIPPSKEKQPSRAMLWCETAISVSEDQLQKSHMQKLLLQLQS